MRSSFYIDPAGGGGGGLTFADIDSRTLTGDVVLDASAPKLIAYTPNADGHDVQLPATYPDPEITIINLDTTVYSLNVTQHTTGALITPITPGLLGVTFVRLTADGPWIAP